MSSTQHQLIEQCATRLRGIVEALDNIHDTSPHRWSTDLDDVHSSAESLLALIKDQAPAQAAQGLAGAALAQPSPAQAEAERPEVVAYADPVAFATFKERGHEGGVAGREWMWAEPGAALVAMSRTDECERIVGALRAKADQLREALEWRKENQAGQRELLRSVTAERDAALARVAELERQEPVVRAYGVLPPFAEKVLAKLRRFYDCAEDFESGGVDIGRHWLDLLTQLGLLNRVQRSPALWEISQQGEDLLEAPVAQAQQLNDLDKQCRDDVARALGLRPNQERGFAWSYLLASIKSCVKASGDSAQAQHSAGYAEARQCVNCRHIGINDAADYAACHDCRWTGPEPDEDKCPGCAGENCMAAACPECGGRYELVAEAKISTPAAQAGQMPQAWLDVQAERRRQIEAEGWTPEHDDEHADGQMAQAAGCYALHAGGIGTDWPDGLQNGAALFWPWYKDSWKPTTPRRDLVKACALALAEIERLDRAGISQSPQPGATTASS
ncbi:hypothetical protein [Pseudomonas aeruginosa]|uniref:hypothetical protein n=1 Tax=Pseudomonas aeruginosa TaxID=287 RepID=UPI0019694C0D|nr:hypothetical protein [Pseudomonas aeruginosa]HBO5047556.1 hypothetical protein [Pseudomonas aeruginosa]